MLTGDPISFDCVAVVPVLIGPLQILVAVLPPLLGALGAMLLAIFKPAAIRVALRVMWRNKLLTAGVVVVIVGAVCLVSWTSTWLAPRASAAVGGGDWPAFRGGPERRGADPGSADPVSGGTVWTFTKDKTFFCSPAAAGGRIFATSADKAVFHDRGAIYCLDADSGAVVWKYSPDDFRATFSSPAVAGGYVVSGEGLHFVRDGRITCLEAATGKPLWQFRTASHVESSPSIYDGKAYVGAGDDGLYCIALQPGADGKPRVLWHLDGKKYPDCEAPPLAHDGKVFFCLGEEGCGICCVDAQTGREIWRVTTPYPVFAGPTLAGGKLFAGMGNGNYVDNAQQVAQKRIEEMRRKGASAAEMAKARQRLAPAGEVWTLDPATGRVLSKVSVKETVLGAPAAADGRLYFGSRDGLFYCLEPDGKTLRKWNARDPIISGPAVGSDHVYFVTEKGRLYGLDRRTFRPVWEADVGEGGSCISSPIVANGHVYVGSAGKGLLCVGRAVAASRPIWAGRLGGPGRSGWADSSAPPSQAAMLWQYPRSPAAANPAAVLVPDVPPAFLEGSLYVGIRREGQAGLARLALGRGPRDGPSEQWFYPARSAPHGSPVVGGEVAYFVDGRPGDKGRSLHAVDIATGQAKWKKPLADDAPGGLLLTQDRLFVCDAPNRITMIDVSCGAAGPTWSSAVPGIVGAPATAAGLVLVGSAKSGVVALDVATGNAKWLSSVPEPITAAPVATEDFVVVGAGGKVCVLSVVDGKVLWSAHCGSSAGAFVCDEDRMACTTDTGEVVVWDWMGKEILRRKGGLPGMPPMLCGAEVLYATAGAIERVELASGRQSRLAEAACLNEAAAPAILANSRLYLVTKSSGLVCLGSKE
jgi:outer membrane protein assembly factor BamB